MSGPLTIILPNVMCTHHNALLSGVGKGPGGWEMGHCPVGDHYISERHSWWGRESMLLSEYVAYNVRHCADCGQHMPHVRLADGTLRCVLETLPTSYPPDYRPSEDPADDAPTEEPSDD